MLLDWIALQNNHKNISKMHSSNGTTDQYANKNIKTWNLFYDDLNCFWSTKSFLSD